jgi:signal transduction histidine kinase
VSWLRSALGRRLVVRLYVFEAVLFACVAALIFVVGRVVMQPALHAARHEPLAWMFEDMLAQQDAPARVQQRIDRLRERTGAKVSVYGIDGHIIASSAPPVARALDGAVLERVLHERTVTLSRHLFVVGHQAESGRLGSYAIVDWEPEQPLWKAAILLGAALVVLGLGSTFLARAIARPLERLADVTRAFGLGELRARANARREDEIGDLGRAFNEMADRIETLRRAEKELLANVSHELRTPLARIRVGIELADGGDPRATQRYLGGIAEDLTEVEQLLGEIITAARLDLSNEQANDPYPPLRLTPTPLGTVVDALVRRFRDAHADRPFQVSIECDPTVPVDRIMLKHALSNVLDNAHKYSPAGRPIELRLRVENGDGRHLAVVDVRDHGQGIDPDDVPHVFTPFFRADRSRRRETGGVGLGLTLARRIVEAHGGTIDLESRRGEGTRVRIILPAGARA